MRSMSTANIIDLEEDISYLHFVKCPNEKLHHIDLTYRYVRRCNSANPTVIFLHDSRKTKESWDKVISDNSMQAKYIMYSLDMRGYGKSPCGGGSNYTKTSIIEDIYNFITRHDLEKVVLVGNGCGAKFAAEYCSSYPDTIIACVLYEVNLDNENSIEEDEEMINRFKSCSRIHNYYEIDKNGKENPLHYKSAKDEFIRCGYSDKEIEYLFSEDGEGCHYVDNVIDLVHYSVVMGLHPFADYLYEKLARTINIWICIEECAVPFLIAQKENYKYKFSSIHLRKIKTLSNITTVPITDYGEIWPPYRELIEKTIPFVESILEELKQREIIDELW